jgi:hypothetical protein
MIGRATEEAPDELRENPPRGIERRSIRWLPIVLQTLVLLGGIIGFTITKTSTDERRYTILEQTSKVHTEALDKVVSRLELLQQSVAVTVNEIKTIQKRHDREDDRK